MQKTHLKTIFFLLISLSIKGQSDTTQLTDMQRTFMPTLQIGYVNHLSNELSAGLLTQTSLEYRDISNFIFRVNYDIFNSDMNVAYPISGDVKFTGKTTFSDVIGGIGYLLKKEKHHLTTFVQAGVRFNGYPTLTNIDGNVYLDYKSTSIGVMRYTVGYEYVINRKLLFSIEGLLSQTTNSAFFWTDNKWSYGMTIGISAPLN